MTAKIGMASVRRRAVLAMAIGTAVLAGAARSEGVRDLVDVAVVDRDTGQALRVWRHDGRLFVAGRPGARYGLRISNHSPERILVVTSVDGVNVVTGQTADYGQSGYVLDPYQSYDITGWRKSDSEVAAFTFASLRDSYAARTGRPNDVGVIGVAAFLERTRPPPAAIVAPPAPVAAAPPAAGSAELEEMVVTGQRRAAPSPAPAAPRSVREPAPQDTASAARRSEKLGTGHGEREWSWVTNVAFERATRYPQQIRQIEYDTYENLAAAGVIPPGWDRGRPPRPFPGSGGGRYAPDPPAGR